MAEGRGNGKRLGDYELIERVSSGGEGTVYKARCAVDSNPNVRQGEIVAVKVMRHTADDTAGRARYEREIKSFLTFSHPNIVGYKDSFVEQDEWGEDLRCIAVEFLHGSDLKHLISEHPSGIPWVQLKSIVVQTLEALCYAGEKGIIHRDISPSNIFVEPDGLVKVIDFGIARRKDSETATTAGFKGKFDYMAPDFLNTETNFRGDEQSDVFSLGVCFYEALTGRLPFSTERETGSVGYLNRWHQEEMPEPQLDLPVFRVMNDATAAFVRKALVADRTTRYASFIDMLADFEGLQCRTVRTETGVYEFNQYLGKGGFGEVFKARRLDDGKIFAVKHLFSGHDPARFMREARLLQEHAHPNLVRYEDFVQIDRLGGDDLYLILEFLDGMPGWSLRNRLREAGALDVHEVRRLFSAYLEALQFLHTSHEKAIVHRDITPANLYAPPTDSDQLPKIFDLGIARSEKTQTSGRVPGNPQYMAPELVLESEARGTPQSDIYNIGLCLYETLCGRPAFGYLPRETMRMWNEVMRRVEGKVDIDFDLPIFRTYPALKQIVITAIARKPEERYGSAAEMREALMSEAAIAEQTPASMPDRPPQPASRGADQAAVTLGEEEQDQSFVLSDEDFGAAGEGEDVETMATWALGMEPAPDDAEEEEPATVATSAIEFLSNLDLPPPPPEPPAPGVQHGTEPLPGLGDLEDEDEDEDFPETVATVGLGMQGAPAGARPQAPAAKERPDRVPEFPPPQPRAKDLPPHRELSIAETREDEDEDFPETVAAIEPAPPPSPVAAPIPVAPAPRVRKPFPMAVVWGTLAVAAVAAIAVGGWFYWQKGVTLREVKAIADRLPAFAPTQAYVEDLRSRIVRVDTLVHGEETPQATAIRTDLTARWDAVPDAFADAFGAALDAGDTDKAAAIVQAWRDAQQSLVFGTVTAENVKTLLQSMNARQAFAVRLQTLANVERTTGYLAELADASNAAESGAKTEPLPTARAWWTRASRQITTWAGMWADTLAAAMTRAATKPDATALNQALKAWEEGVQLEQARGLLPGTKRLTVTEAAKQSVQTLLDGESTAVVKAYQSGNEARAVELHQAFRQLPQRLPGLHQRAATHYEALLKSVDAEQVTFLRDRIMAVAVPKSIDAYAATENALRDVAALYERFGADWSAAQRQAVDREGETHCVSIANALADSEATAGLLDAFEKAVPPAFGKAKISRIAEDWRKNRQQIRDAVGKLAGLGPLLSAAMPTAWQKGLTEWRALDFEANVLETTAVQSKWQAMAGILEQSLSTFVADCSDVEQLALARGVLVQAGQQKVFALDIVSRLQDVMDVRRTVLELRRLAALLGQDDPTKLSDALTQWENLQISAAMREHEQVLKEWIGLVSQFEGAVLRYLGRCARLEQLAPVEDLLAAAKTVPGVVVVQKLRESLADRRKRLLADVAGGIAKALKSDVVPLLVAEDPASWERGIAAWAALGVNADLRSHEGIVDNWAAAEQTLQNSVLRFADRLQPEARLDGLKRVQRVADGKTAQRLLGDTTRAAIDTALKKHMSTFMLGVRNALPEPLSVQLAGVALGVLETGTVRTFPVEAGGKPATLTCVTSAAFYPYEQRVIPEPGGGRMFSVETLKARPRALSLPRLSDAPPATFGYLPAGGGGSPVAIADDTLLEPGNYRIVYARPDYESRTVALAIEPGVDAVAVPPPGEWHPSTALGGLVKLEGALDGGDVAVADRLVELVSVSKYQWPDHGRRARQAIIKWKQQRAAGVTQYWKNRQYGRAEDACKALADVCTAAGRDAAVEVCRFNAALCRYLAQEAGSDARLQAAEDVLALAEADGVRAAAVANEEREWISLLQRKLSGFIKLRKKNSKFAGIDEAEATACIQRRTAPFPLPD